MPNMLDTSNKKYKIEVSGKSQSINDNSESVLIEDYMKWLEDEFPSSPENGLQEQGAQESFLVKVEVQTLKKKERISKGKE